MPDAEDWLTGLELPNVAFKHDWAMNRCRETRRHQGSKRDEPRKTRDTGNRRNFCGRNCCDPADRHKISHVPSRSAPWVAADKPVRKYKMAKKMLIDATHAEETRVVVVDGNKVEEFDFESQSKRQLAGNIYLAKVTRVEPSLQAAFVDYGGNRHGFLAFSEIHPDYYQIPVADREALIAEEKAYAEAMKAEAEAAAEKPKRRRRRKPKAEEILSEDAVVTTEVSGMETIDLDAEAEDNGLVADGAAETPVEEQPETGDAASAADVDAKDADDARTDEQTPDAATSDADAPAEDSKASAEVTVDDSNDTNDEDDDDAGSDASEKDENIESVADEDDSEDVRPVRKPRPKRYKIQEVINVRQILLVQVVKEERGNKGAALTTYLSLAGRYCVLMPNTARGGGISRKITNAADRKKLKEIANEIDVPDGAGLIVRTAGAKRTKPEIRRDYEYLQRLWEEIRSLTLQSIAPAKIYEEGDLIKRSIRDLYNRDIDEVLVEGEGGYRVAKDFMKMIMPSHAKNVKLYNDSLPLFARYQVESYLAGMFNPVVQLPSGGYIVIGVTEALVAVDVNSGRATKEGSIEQTALKTNLEASDEVARQLRLRDLAGLIVIDYIDMDERRNNNAVEKRLKDKLKTDRARIQVGRISGFGLLEMSRQRLRPGMLEATTQPCPHCHGTGLLRSDDSTALSILRQIEEEGVRGRSKEVLVKAPFGITNFIMNQKRDHVAQIEARYGLSVRIEGDPQLISPDFSIEKFKTATRVVAEAPAAVSVSAALMEDIDEEAADAIETEVEAEDAPQPKKRRRRRRRRRGGGNADGEQSEQANASSENAEAPEGSETPVAEDAKQDAPEAEVAEDAPKPKRKRTRRKKSDDAAEVAEEKPAETAEVSETPDDAEKPKKRRTRKKKDDVAASAPADEKVEAKSEETTSEDKPAEEKPKRKRAPRKKKVEATAEADATAEAQSDAVEDAPKADETVEEKPKRKRAPRKKKADTAVVPAETVAEPATETVVAVAEPEPAPEPVTPPVAETKPDPDKPKRKGWWSLGK